MRESFRRCSVSLGTLVLVAACASTGNSRRVSPESATATSGFGDDKTQLITVVSSDWDDPSAVLQRYSRTAGQGWTPVGGPIDVVLGYAGYAWGRGLHGSGPPLERGGPIKREGDGRSPAGVFALGPIYGYAESLPGTALPYLQATPDLRCVDDPNSAYYNRIVPSVRSDWTSAELMRRDDDIYEIAIVVQHNAAPATPEAGSCIFLHPWASPDTPVRGCTAMSKVALEELARWLRSDAAILVALPDEDYAVLAPAWGLPRPAP